MEVIAFTMEDVETTPEEIAVWDESE